MSWRYKLNACDTRLMRETWHHSNTCTCNPLYLQLVVQLAEEGVVFVQVTMKPTWDEYSSSLVQLQTMTTPIGHPG